MKCAICGKELQNTFLGKMRGNIVKSAGKTNYVCNECFKENQNNIKQKVNKSP